MTNYIYASEIFAEKFNTYFGEAARSHKIPDKLTDVRSQEGVQIHWNYEKLYADAIKESAEQYTAAKVLQHNVEVYRIRLIAAIENYKTFIKNIESEYDFSKVTWWPYIIGEYALNGR